MGGAFRSERTSVLDLGGAFRKEVLSDLDLGGSFRIFWLIWGGLSLDLGGAFRKRFFQNLIWGGLSEHVSFTPAGPVRLLGKREHCSGYAPTMAACTPPSHGECDTEWIRALFDEGNDGRFY